MAKKKLVGLIGFGAIAALVLSGCGRVLAISSDVVAPGATIVVNSTAEAECKNNDGPVETDVHYAISYEPTQNNPATLPHALSTESNENGEYEFSIAAPHIPGPYAVLARCDMQFDLIDEVSWQAFAVSQTDLELTVSATDVEQGADVTATATWCQAESTYGFGDLPSENPVMTFLLNGEVITTIEATETNPPGTVDALIEIAELGTQEIEAVCTYSAIEADFSALEGQIPSPENIRAALTGSDGELRQSVEVNAIAVDEPGSNLKEPTEVGAAPIATTPAFTG